jgi:hypothetical protein
MAYNNCQSCGMPMKKDPQGGGSEADGSKSEKYCSHCYRGGAFKAPDMSAEEMQDLVRGKLKEMKFPGFIAAWLARGVPKLERWRN